MHNQFRSQTAAEAGRMIASQRAAEAALFYGGAGIFQRSAKPENRAAFYGRLKPPSSTVARAFFRGLRSPKTGPHSTGGRSRPLLRLFRHLSASSSASV